MKDLLLPVLSMLLTAALVAILCFCSKRKGGWAKNAPGEIVFTFTMWLLLKTGEGHELQLITFTVYYLFKNTCLFQFWMSAI